MVMKLSLKYYSKYDFLNKKLYFMNKKIKLQIILIGIIPMCHSSFAKLAKNNPYKFLGNITTNYQVRSDFDTYWNQITAKNECKWDAIEPSSGVRNWVGANRVYNNVISLNSFS